MTKNEINSIVVRYFKEEFPYSNFYDVKKITKNSSFKEDLITDSLDDVEILMWAEKKFNIPIKEEEVMSCKTIKEFCDCIYEIIKIKH